MTAGLKRQGSDSSSDESRSVMSYSGLQTPTSCATPGCESKSSASCCETPIKRRRLKIKEPSCEVSDKFSRLTEASISKKVQEETGTNWTLEDFADRSASRFDGVTEKAERLHRLASCTSAREAIRRLMGSGSVKRDDLSLSAQVLACQLVQKFLLMNSLTRESPAIVGLGAALVALKAAGLACRAEDVIAVCEPELETARWAAKYPEDSLPLRPLRDPCWAVDDVALRLSVTQLADGSSASSSAVPATALDFIDRNVSLVEQGVVTSKAFASRPVALPLQELTEVSRGLVVDAVQGPCAALLKPAALAAAAVVLAARLLLSRAGLEVSSEEFLSFVEGKTLGLPSKQDLDLASREVAMICTMKEESCWCTF